MPGRKLFIGAMVAVMVGMLIYVSYGLVNAGKKKTYHSVAVILDDSGHDRWNALKEGLEQGAEEYPVYLNMVFTGTFQDQEEECAVIRRELENGAEGIIVQATAEDSLDLFADTVGETPVVLLENDMEAETPYTVVAADPYGLGAAVAQSVLSGEEKGVEGLRIGVLSGNQRMHSQRECLEGFQSAMKDSGAKIVWTLSEEEWDRAPYAGQPGWGGQTDVVVALDNQATESAIAYLQENSDVSWRVYGEGRSEKAVYYLDRGPVEALVVPNGFYMGYRSLEAMARKLKIKAAGEEKNVVDFLTVTRENLYDKNVEKILFPIVG